MESVTIKVDEKDFTFYHQSKDFSKPLVVLIQEWWGVNDQMKGMAGKLQEEGKYNVAIPDLYDGFCAKSVDEASHSMNNLNFPEAVKRISLLIKWFKDQGTKKAGVTGFCMGGALSLAVAVAGSGADAIVMQQGTPPREQFEWSKCTVPVQGHFGELDTAEFATVATMNKLKEALDGASVVNEFHTQNANHAFMNKDMELRSLTGFKPDYDDSLAVQAWVRMNQWWEKYLN